MSSSSSSRRGTLRGAGGRGRGSGSGSGTWRGKDARGHIPTPTPQPLGSTIDSISRTLLVEEDAPTIQDVQYVASYNWLDGKSPVILVPGSPPAWTPPVEDTKLKPDSGDVFRDINAARYSSYPLEPALRALKAMEPQFDLQSVDIVGCGSTMGNLLGFAASQSKPFRFDVDVIRDTVLFVRRENSPTELIMGIQGYGHTFPEAYTTWDADVRNSCSHQRIVQYEFGGLKFLVRSETDGYVKDPRLDILKRPQATEPQSLDDALGSVALGYNVVNAGQQLEVRFQGTKVPQGQIFDLKTRRSNTQFDMEEILPRLWVNQTSKFVIAYHKFGVFDNPKVEDVRRQVSDWESRNSTLLARFHAVIKRIVDVVRDSKDQQCEVSWDGEGLLRVTKQIGEGRKALPSNVAQSFEL